MNDNTELVPGLRHAIDVNASQRQALIEFSERIASRYPGTQFELSRGIDNPDTMYLVAVVDLDDPDVVIDLVIDRVIDLLVNEDIHVGVLPVPIPERSAAMRIEQLLQQQELSVTTRARA